MFCGPQGVLIMGRSIPLRLKWKKIKTVFILLLDGVNLKRSFSIVESKNSLLPNRIFLLYTMEEKYNRPTLLRNTINQLF